MHAGMASFLCVVVRHDRDTVLSICWPSKLRGALVLLGYMAAFLASA